MSEPVFNQGDVMPVSVQWKIDGVNDDPDEMYLAIEVPGSAEVVYHYGDADGFIIRTGVGAYEVKAGQIDTGAVYGRYQGRWFATGFGQGAVPWTAYVVQSNVVMVPVP